ncbi:MAG TPA: DUF3224 domain-containing protein [Rickettsiales bacterium]|nr:DUF3224 domain-containing protein [Rickettsiales bacterium]
MKTIQGAFEVKATPQPVDDTLQHIGAGRMTFEKTFTGPLEATSVVAMMGIMDMKTQSGGYVALEKVTGKVEGIEGSFCLQHSSAMNKGTPAQYITVVPGTGTGELAGLKGDMTIDIKDGKHFYTFRYMID